MSDPSRWGLPLGTAEIVERRTRHSKHFRRPDGAFVAVFGRYLHFESSPGVWEDCDYGFLCGSEGEVSDRAHSRVRLLATSIEIVDQFTGMGVAVAVPSGRKREGAKIGAVVGGATWEWERVRSGLKAQRIVASSIGRKTFAFSLSMLGGERLEEDANGNLVGHGVIMPRARAYGADGSVHVAGPWKWDGKTARFSWDDRRLPAGAYPYVLDPTTFSVTTGGNDGTLLSAEDASYPPAYSSWDSAQNVITAAKTYAASVYRTRVSVIRWDTSAITASGVITAASLRVYIPGKGNANSRTLNGEIFTPSGWSPSSGDYTNSVGTGSFSVNITSGLTSSAYNTLDVADYASINKTGYTAMRFGVSGSTPSGTNYVDFSSYESTTRDEPQLIVAYSLNASVLVSGYGATMASGTVDKTAGAQVAVTGKAVSAAAGTVAVSASAVFAAAGSQVGAAAGSTSQAGAAVAQVEGREVVAAAGAVQVGAGAVVAATGAGATAASGDPEAAGDAVVEPAGHQVVASSGEVGVETGGSVVVPISGHAATAAHGSVGVAASALREVVGHAMSIAAGIVVVTATAVVAPIGHQAAAAQGAVQCAATAVAQPQGYAASALAGVISAEAGARVAAQGEQAVASAGGPAVSAGAIVPAQGAAVSAQSGSVVVVAEAGVVVVVSGYGATALAGTVQPMAGAVVQAGGATAVAEHGSVVVAGSAVVAAAGYDVHATAGDVIAVAFTSAWSWERVCVVEAEDRVAQVEFEARRAKAAGARVHEIAPQVRTHKPAAREDGEA